jgi:hypothetical protein
MDLGKGAVEADAVTPADELDVAVDLVVAAADERGLGKAGNVAIDERSRSMVVDREKDDIALSDDIADVRLIEVERDRLAGEACFADPAGEGLGLVGADGRCRELLAKRVAVFEDVAVDEHEQGLARTVGEIPNEWRQQL